MKARLRRRASGVVLFVLLLSPGCAGTVPKSLFGPGVVAFQGTRAIKVLDLIRDAAVDANATNPPLMSEKSTREVVEYHRSAIITIHEAPSGWKNTVLTGLKELVKNLPPAEQVLISPYVASFETLMAELQ